MAGWIIPVAIVFAAFVAFSTVYVVQAHRRKVSAGREDLIGRTAVVEIALNPKGVVLVEGERWTAMAEKGPIAIEQEVTITSVDGLRLTVKKKE